MSEDVEKSVLPTTTIRVSGKDTSEFKLLNPATWCAWVSGLTLLVIGVVTKDHSLFGDAINMFLVGAGLPAGYTAARTYLKSK